MSLQIPQILTAEQVAQFRARMDSVAWVAGNVTSGHRLSQPAPGNPALVSLSGCFRYLLRMWAAP